MRGAVVGCAQRHLLVVEHAHEEEEERLQHKHEDDEGVDDLVVRVEQRHADVGDGEEDNEEINQRVARPPAAAPTQPAAAAVARAAPDLTD